MPDEISIDGLDKAKVLMALFNGSRPLGLGFLHYDPKPMAEEVARDLISQGAYFDYVQGRVMKVDLSGDSFNPWLYDRDNGEGAAKRIVDTLRITGEVNPVATVLRHKDGTREAAGQAMEGIAIESGVRSESGSLVAYELGMAGVANELKPRLDAVLSDWEIAVAIKAYAQGCVLARAYVDRDAAGD